MIALVIAKRGSNPDERLLCTGLLRFARNDVAYFCLPVELTLCIHSNDRYFNIDNIGACNDVMNVHNTIIDVHISIMCIKNDNIYINNNNISVDNDNMDVHSNKECADSAKGMDWIPAQEAKLLILILI
ncbi:MAG: hypothetical protein LBE13_17670 [Bacteroidales bacterium]|nr:hypothetical protein [Bacteroidales bacterium]